MAHSVGERVIFRELFAYGLTVMDQRTQQGKTNPGYQEISKITDQILSFQDKIYFNQQRSHNNQTTTL
jgi:hypothetical protein